MERRRQYFREVRLALEKRHQSKSKSRQKAYRIATELGGTGAQTSGVVLVKKSDSNIDWNGRGGKLEHER